MFPGKGKYRNVLTVVFIAIMLFNYANATLFWHCHRIGSASVVHSHIYGKSHGTGNSTGGHTPGQLQIIDVICHALYTADAEAWYAVISQCSEGVILDLADNNAYWAKWESPVEDAAKSVYDGYLKSQGQEQGIKSYGACVDLIVEYYLNKAF